LAVDAPVDVGAGAPSALGPWGAAGA